MVCAMAAPKGAHWDPHSVSDVALILNMEKENYFKRKYIEILIFSKMEQEAPELKRKSQSYSSKYTG